MNRFILCEDEKERILNLHESATKRHYLSEQIVTNYDKTYDYKKEGEEYFYKLKNANDWTKASGKGLDAIKTQVYNKPSVSSPKPSVPSSNPSVPSSNPIGLVESPFTTKKHGIEYREWLNTTLPNIAKKYVVSSPSKLSEKFKNTEAFYNNKNILNSLNQTVTWGSGDKKGQKISVWDWYRIKNPKWGDKSEEEKIESGDYKVPNTVEGADRINKELLYINKRPEYNDKPFLIVDPRLNLVLAFDNQHKLVDYSQSVAGADKQQDVLFTRKMWCEISHKDNSFKDFKGREQCIRTVDGKVYVSDESVAEADEKVGYLNKIYDYPTLSKEHKRYAQKGIYGIGTKSYVPEFQGQEGIPNTFSLKKDGINVPTAIHALVPIPGRIAADDELKELLKKDLSLGTIPKEYIDMVEKDFLSTATEKKFDKSSGCFNVDPKFIQDSKVQMIFNYPGVPVFIMGEQDTDYLVQVEPGKEGEFMLDLGGGKTVNVLVLLR
jgi:peptidoglycan hydrolase-like protein with peptidoglycan-binding domain